MSESALSSGHESVHAGRAWTTGKACDHDGEVAMFYAEQARAINDELRAIALNVE